MNLPGRVACALLPALACGAAVAATIDFNHDTYTPDAAQVAAIRRAAAADLADLAHPEDRGYSVALADLNDDGRPDLIVQYSDMAFCGAMGCSGVIVLATAGGYADHAIDLPNFYGVLDVLATKRHGMHDLRFNGDSPVWHWDGHGYGLDPEDLPFAKAPPWETRRAAGRTLAMVATIDSSIEALTVYCDGGRPVLALLLPARPKLPPKTLSFGFRGWTVNAALEPGNGDGTLWLADLSASDLPLWLAHRGTTPTTRELARLADIAFLKIDGALEGEISLKASTAATRAALAACYRY